MTPSGQVICDDEVASRGEGACAGTPPSVLEGEEMSMSATQHFTLECTVAMPNIVICTA